MVVGSFLLSMIQVTHAASADALNPDVVLGNRFGRFMDSFIQEMEKRYQDRDVEIDNGRHQIDNNRHLRRRFRGDHYWRRYDPWGGRHWIFPYLDEGYYGRYTPWEWRRGGYGRAPWDFDVPYRWWGEGGDATWWRRGYRKHNRSYEPYNHGEPDGYGYGYYP